MENKKNYYREIRKSFYKVKRGNQRLFAKVLKAFAKLIDVDDIAANGFDSRFYLDPEQLMSWIEYCERQFNLSKQSIYVNGKGEVYRPIPVTVKNYWEWTGIPRKTVSLYNKLCKRCN